MRDPGRRPCEEEWAVLRAIRDGQVTLAELHSDEPHEYLPDSYHPADFAWLSCYGWCGWLANGTPVLTEKGKQDLDAYEKGATVRS